MRGFTTHEVMAYSAYYDVRDSHKPIIRVIGVTRRKDPEKVICRMYYKYGTGTSGGKYNNNISLFINYNDTTIEPFRDVRGKISVLEEALYKPNSTKSSLYHPCYISCPLKGDKLHSLKNSLPPVAVSIMPLLSSDLTHTNTLRILNSNNGGTGTKRATNNEIGLCVKPIHSSYDNWLELVSFIELNKILGVSRFIIYNESISERISCVLKYYKEQEENVSLLTWNLFKESNFSMSDMRNRGVMASINDCFYRNMNKHQYLFSVDLDEFIVPKMHETIPEMLKYLQSNDVEYLARHWKQEQAMKNVQNRSSLNTTTAYNFLNAFFYQQYGKNFICF